MNEDEVYVPPGMEDNPEFNPEPEEEKPEVKPEAPTFEIDYDRLSQSTAQAVMQAVSQKPEEEEPIDFHSIVDDPEAWAKKIREDAIREAEARADAKYGSMLQRVAKQSVESNVLGRIPEHAKPFAQKILDNFDPVELANLNEEAYHSIANMAIGQAYMEGKLTPPRMPQSGEPVGGGVSGLVQYLGGTTQDEVDAYKMFTGKDVDAKWLRENGYGR